MTTLRRFCIAAVILGVFLLRAGSDEPFDVVPFPGKGLKVKTIDEVKTEGDYILTVKMPRADNAVGTRSEQVPCSVKITLGHAHTIITTDQISSFVLSSEFGWAGIQSFDMPKTWHLEPGHYELEIENLQDCPIAMSRGATIGLEQQLTQPTERYLAGILRHWAGLIFLSFGLIGLIGCEFKSESSKHDSLAHL